jgi:hypothetical protein
MTAPTVAVTVSLDAMGGPALAGVVVTATLDKNEVYGGIVIAKQVSGTTDVNGEVVLQLFPNAPSPAGLGTQGSTYRIRAPIPGGRSLDRRARVPNTPCNLHEILVDDDEEAVSLSSAQIAVSQAQDSAIEANDAVGLAKNWATKTDAEVVAGQGYGSKKYAQDAAGSAGAAAGSAGAAAGSAGAAAGSAAAAAASRTAVDNRLYPGTYGVMPATRPDGSAIQNGDRFIYNVDGYEYVRVAGAWTNAASSAQSAVISATQAANYAAAAATGAKFFDTIALGRAGVADGATFGVKAGGADALARPSIYRRESAGVSTLLYGVLPASEFDAVLPALSPNGYVWAVVDGNFVACIGVASDGTFKAARADLTALNAGALTLGGGSDQVIGQAPYGYVWAILSPDGMATMALRSDGTMTFGDVELLKVNGYPAKMVTAPANAANKAGTYLAEINHIISYGQSLSTGADGYYIQTQSQAFDSLMFTAGMIAVNGAGSQAANHAALVPLVEIYVPGSSAQIGESPMGNASATIKRLIRDENNLAYTEHSYQLLASCTGIGGTSIAGLSKGSTGYTNLLADIGFGMTRAAALGKSYNVPVIYWTHGEQDVFGSTSYATYLAALLQLYTDLNTDVKAATGQTNDIYLICDQVSDNANVPPRTNVALAQLQASKTNPKIVLAAPTYHLPHYLPGNAHLTGPAYGTLGGHYGVAYKRTLIDGVKFKPVMPISTVRQGAIVLVRFNVPTPPLVLDPNLFAGATNSGFSLVDNLGVDIAITAVSVVGPDTVKIVAAAAVPVGSKVRYGFTTWGGNLRDSQGNLIDAGLLSPLPLHNPCITFEEVLA